MLETAIGIKLPAWKKTTYLVLFLFFLIFIIPIYSFYYLYVKATPDASELITKKVSETSIIYDRTGEHILYELFDEENRKIISAEDIPLSIRAATIATEDRSFYNHQGIDISGIIRAIRENLIDKKFGQGGSTITQQLARNRFFSREKTLKRKILEIVMAIKIERHFSKDDILVMYLNTIPYGSNAYGIEAATQTFFGKHASELTLDESALLASLPQAPSLYSPYLGDQEKLLARQQSILDSIAEIEPALKETIAEAKKINVLEKIKPLRRNILAPHFVFYVKEELLKVLGKDFVEKGGYQVYTTLDYEKQKIGEAVIKEGSEKNLTFNASNASLVSIDPKNGEILTMVGSRDYFNSANKGQVNVTTQSRQPGSSFKPIVYAAAFEKGYQPENLVFDVPTDFGPDGSGKNYVPHNYDGQSHGMLSLRNSLAMSLNIPAVKIMYLVGIADALDMAERLGINTLKNKNRYGLSLVLGSGGVTLLEETSAFGVFANDGIKNPPHSIIKVTDSKQNVIMNHETSTSQAIHNQIARKINSVLSDNNARARTFGSSNNLVIAGKTTAGKTGTTQEFRDAWTVGYTPSVVTGVWVGNNDNTPMKNGADGMYIAAPIWNNYMSRILKDSPDEKFIDYDHFESDQLKNIASKMKVVYYNNKTGRYVSEKKAKNTDSEKIEIKIEYADIRTENGLPLYIEMQPTEDAMIQSWKKSIEKSYLKKEDEEKKDDEDDD